MAMRRLLAVLAIGGATATAPASAKSQQKQSPLDFGIRLPAPKEERQLRGLLGDELPMRVAFGGLPMGAIPMGAIPMGAIRLEIPEDLEEMSGPPVVDGPLRDLLEFGSVMGAAVAGQPMHLHELPGAPLELRAMRGFRDIGGEMGGPLKLPMDALHLKMQEHVPAPLSVDDSHGKVRIFGTLPQKLTAKTLKVTLSAGEPATLLVEYFLGQGADSSKQLVGIDERFDLDFEPVDQPAVTYKSSTGAFELVLARPAAKPRKQVSIDFDTAAPIAAKPAKLMVEPKSREVTTVKTAKAALKHAKAAMEKAVPAPAHDSEMARLRASEAETLQAIKAAEKQDLEGLSKVTKELHEAPAITDKDKTVRVKNVATKAKKFVVAAHLDDAQKVLGDAFAPLDLGLVMLEMNHRVRSQ